MKWEEIFEKAKDENGNVTLDSFKKVVEDNKVKLVDLSEDGYVSKNKYTADLEAKAKEITTLNDTISTRDNDLVTLKKQLEEAGTDADKLSTLSTDFTNLQKKYEDDVKSYKEQLTKQAYEFAVREFANGKKFTSQAAKRDFIQNMTAENLKMKNNVILGAEDFVTAYTAENADAFVVEKPAEPTPPAQPKPQFAGATPGASAGDPNAKVSLSEMMKMANDNPGMAIQF